MFEVGKRVRFIHMPITHPRGKILEIDGNRAKCKLDGPSSTLGYDVNDIEIDDDGKTLSIPLSKNASYKPNTHFEIWCSFEDIELLTE